MSVSLGSSPLLWRFSVRLYTPAWGQHAARPRREVCALPWGHCEPTHCTWPYHVPFQWGPCVCLGLCVLTRGRGDKSALSRSNWASRLGGDEETVTKAWEGPRTLPGGTLFPVWDGGLCASLPAWELSPAVGKHRTASPGERRSRSVGGSSSSRSGRRRRSRKGWRQGGRRERPLPERFLPEPGGSHKGIGGVASRCSPRHGQRQLDRCRQEEDPKPAAGGRRGGGARRAPAAGGRCRAAGPGAGKGRWDGKRRAGGTLAAPRDAPPAPAPLPASLPAGWPRPP